MQWEESAYQISLRSDQNWKSYMGPKFSKEVQKYEKVEKNYCFFVITFLFLINCNIMKRIKNSAWYMEPACQISLENIENWQSY